MADQNAPSSISIGNDTPDLQPGAAIPSGATDQPQSTNSQPSQSPGQSTQSFSAGDAIPSGATNDAAPSSDQTTPDTPGLLSRMGETSGITPVAKLAGSSLKASGTNIYDAFSAALDSAEKGDLKGASVQAMKLLQTIQTLGMDKDHPMVKALEGLVTQPIKEIIAGRNETLSGGIKHTFEKAKNDWQNGNKLGAVADVATHAAESHSIGALPLVGGAIQQEGNDLDEDMHAHNYAAIAGDMLGPWLTFGVGKAVGALGEGADAAANTIQDAKVGSTNVAGVDIPQANTVVPVNNSNDVSLGNPGSNIEANAAVKNANNSTNITKTSPIAKAATKEGAKNFVEKQVQPQAIKAANANITSSALDDVDALRAVRGEPSIANSPPLQLNTLDDVTKYLLNESEKTYGKLDAASDQDIADWDAKYGKNGSAIPPEPPAQAKGFAASQEPVQPKAPQPVIPDRPKSFSELQDQVKNAKETIKTGSGASQADRATAIKNLPTFQNEMKAFLDKHAGVVPPEELKAADTLRAQTERYSWLTDRMNAAVKGDPAMGTAPHVNATFLERLPNQFNQKFGSIKDPRPFDRLLGNEGVKNYKAVVKALQIPETGSEGLFKYLNDLPFKVGGVVTKGIPINQIADHLLFNPKAGQTALSLYNLSKQASRVSKIAQAGSHVAPVIGPALNAGTITQSPSLRKAISQAF